MVNPSDNTPPISIALSDVETVLTVQFARERHDALLALMDRVGTLDDAITWSKGMDPLRQGSDALAKMHAAGEVSDETFESYRLNSAFAYQNSAEALIASVAFPDIFADPKNTHWLPEVTQRAGFKKASPDSDWTPYHTITTSLSEFDNRSDLSNDDLARLSLAAEMLDISGTSKFVLSLPGLSKTASNETEALALRKGAQYDKSFAVHLRNTVAEQALLGQDDQIPEYERYAVGLRALWRNTANHLAARTMDGHREQSLAVLQSMIDCLNIIFLERGAIEEATDKNNVKGLLHELMWMLDGYMIMLHDSKYDGIDIVPSFSVEDQPVIGRPLLNRGFDYRIGDIKSSMTRIQLKSSPIVRDVYHEDIKVVTEDNFTDINPRRLAAKLGNYRRVLEGDPTIDAKIVIDKYALKSVQLELDSLLVA